MARIRRWDNLGEAQQRRYERGGISREGYERGDSLKAARGHANTPERPREAEKNPERYRDYYAVRNEVRNLKRQMYGGKDTFNNRLPKGTRAHMETAAQILRAKLAFEGSWDMFWDEHDEWSRDEFIDVEHYH